METTIVYVHGNGNKDPADRLKQQWDVALFGRELGSASRMAYWASVMYPSPRDDHAPEGVLELPSDAQDAGLATPEEFIASTLAEARQAAALSGGVASDAPEVSRQDAALASWLRRMTYSAEALAAGDAAPWPSASDEDPSLSSRLRATAFRAFVRLVFRDVHAYFFGGFKEPLRAVVRDSLRDAPGPLIVVGHSLGSIIAYEVLREADRSLSVPMFVSIGSPLAVREVQEHLRKPLEVPDPVAAWHNVADGFDLVALDDSVRGEYAPVERTRDFLVDNRSWNHHGALEYLHSAPVQQAIREHFEAGTATPR